MLDPSKPKASSIYGLATGTNAVTAGTVSDPVRLDLDSHTESKLITRRFGFSSGQIVVPEHPPENFNPNAVTVRELPLFDYMKKQVADVFATIQDLEQIFKQLISQHEISCSDGKKLLYSASTAATAFENILRAHKKQNLRI